jgi:hypothetical protein
VLARIQEGLGNLEARVQFLLHLPQEACPRQVVQQGSQVHEKQTSLA